MGSIQIPARRRSLSFCAKEKDRGRCKKYIDGLGIDWDNRSWLAASNPIAVQHSILAVTIH